MIRNPKTALILGLLAGLTGIFLLLKGGEYTIQTKGGYSIVLEVDASALFRDIAKSKDTDFELAMREARFNWRADKVESSFIRLFATEIAKVQGRNPKPLSRYFMGADREISFNTPDEEVIKKLEQLEKAASERTFTILRTRAEAFGAYTPTINFQPKGKILVELPGLPAADSMRIYSLMRSPAHFSFWETVPFREAFAILDLLDHRLQNPTTPVEDDTLSEESEEELLETSTLHETPASMGRNLFSDKLKSDPGMAPDQAVMGYVEAADTHAVNALLRSEQGEMFIPPHMQFLWSANPEQENRYALYAIRTNRDQKPLLDGSGITDANAVNDSYNEGRIVDITMNSQAAQVWAKITADHIGQPIAMVLDGKVYCAPVVQGSIVSGRCSISGNFTIEEAREIAAILKSGSLPAQVNILSADYVQATQSGIPLGTIIAVILLGLAVAFIWMYFRNR